MAFANPHPCSDSKNYIDTDTQKSKLFLCSQKNIYKQYPVSFGTGGFGKTRRGDARTPLGTYTLGTPRASTRFITFIPIGYPNADQIKKGYTGSDVGLHGPMKTFESAKRLNTIVNWTDGCIAVGSKEEITEIANWVKKEKVSTIVIR